MKVYHILDHSGGPIPSPCGSALDRSNQFRALFCKVAPERTLGLNPSSRQQSCTLSSFLVSAAILLQCASCRGPRAIIQWLCSLAVGLTPRITRPFCFPSPVFLTALLEPICDTTLTLIGTWRTDMAHTNCEWPLSQISSIPPSAPRPSCPCS